MKFLLLTINIIVCANLVAQETYVNQLTDSIITWKASKKLTWADFQGQTAPDEFGEATTTYTIEVLPTNVIVDEQDRIQDYEKITVKAHFIKSESWTATKDSFLLRHEQLHFDIAELFSRKIRKRFAELKASKEARFSIYSREYSSFWRKSRKYQRQYDSETAHGINKEINKAWELRVKKELEELKDFE